ncbi:hypothetical protein, partial [Treponema pallidum]|uniref:hypothetical protein n=1 Tax=Treponema pallidum TaxID=160 RepID=UPI00385783C0
RSFSSRNSGIKKSKVESVSLFSFDTAGDCSGGEPSLDNPSAGVYASGLRISFGAYDSFC